MFAAVLYKTLTTDETLAGTIDDRLFPNVIPVEEALPAIAYQLMDEEEEETHQGPAGILREEYQFTIQDATHDGAITVESGLCMAIENMAGQIILTAGAGSTAYKVARVKRLSKTDGYNLSGETYTRRIRYEIQYKERSAG